jgi:small subunit ribosomal protein S5
MPRNLQQKRRSKGEKKEFEEEVLQVDRVTRVVKGGRRLSFRVTVIIGNRKGKVGVGLGKATEVNIAVEKAVRDARKNLMMVPMVGESIPHDVRVKFKATKLILIPASSGTGLKAGSATRKILELAGVKSILSKRFGSGNRINMAKATINALKMLREPRKPALIKRQEDIVPTAPVTLKPKP